MSNKFRIEGIVKKDKEENEFCKEEINERERMGTLER
jgi:hypothetical protein